MTDARLSFPPGLGIGIPVCPSVYLTLCLSVCPPVCPAQTWWRNTNTSFDTWVLTQTTVLLPLGRCCDCFGSSQFYRKFPCAYALFLVYNLLFNYSEMFFFSLGGGDLYILCPPSTPPTYKEHPPQGQTVLFSTRIRLF